MVRYQDIKTKAYRILDLTSLTVEEFEQLVPAFEAAFVRHMRERQETAPYAFNVLLGAATGTVPFLSDTYEGSCHDKPIADQTPYPLPEGSE